MMTRLPASPTINLDDVADPEAEEVEEDEVEVEVEENEEEVAAEQPEEDESEWAALGLGVVAQRDSLALGGRVGWPSFGCRL